MRRMHRFGWVGLAATVLLASCGGPVRFLDPEADMGYYEQVGVVPFTTLSQDRASGQRITNLFFTELLRKDFAGVVEPGQFTASMIKVRGGDPPENPWSSQHLAALAEETGAQAFFMGTVREYDFVHSGRETFPLLSLEVRLVDAATGRLVWSASDTRKGGPGFPFLGLGETHTMGELAANLCRDLLGTLP